jgi:hypothetical protein
MERLAIHIQARRENANYELAAPNCCAGWGSCAGGSQRTKRPSHQLV